MRWWIGWLTVVFVLWKYCFDGKCTVLNGEILQPWNGGTICLVSHKANESYLTKHFAHKGEHLQ